MTGGARFLKKKKKKKKKKKRRKDWGPELGSNGPKSGVKLVFCHFLKFGSLFFLEIAYNDSLQQCLTSGGDKIYEKNFCGPNLGQRGEN